MSNESVEAQICPAQQIKIKPKFYPITNPITKSDPKLSPSNKNPSPIQPKLIFKKRQNPSHLASHLHLLYHLASHLHLLHHLISHLHLHHQMEKRHKMIRNVCKMAIKAKLKVHCKKKKERRKELYF